jgi:hypothetical protein
LGHALIVYVSGRMFPAGSAMSGVMTMAGLFAGSTTGIAGLLRSTSRMISDGSALTASTRRSTTVVGSAKFVHAAAEAASATPTSNLQDR